MSVEAVTIGAATLYLGDCREVLPALGMVDAIVTDPPYGIPHKFSPQKGAGRKGTRTLNFSWDTLSINSVVFDAISAIALKVQSAFVFCGLTQASVIAGALRAAGLIDKPAAWVKKCPAPAAPGNWWPSAFELAVYAYRRGAWFGDTDTKRRNVFIADSYRHGQPGKVAHPTQKPLVLMERIVGAIVAPGRIALDPFMGSGTTGVACAQLGRRFIGIEIEPRYFEIACHRIEAAQIQERMAV